MKRFLVLLNISTGLAALVIVASLFGLTLSSCAPKPAAQACTVERVPAQDSPGEVSRITCPDGTSVDISNGHDGLDGHDGMNGSDGTTLTMVKFCPDEPAYPSTFPEYGFLIDGVVYGVYSTNGGFLAALPPGVYVSNAIGSACTFTINADGTISN